MTSLFERLPAEVFDMIAAYLDLSAYQTLRLTSQRLHLLSLSTFTTSYFAKLITTLGSPSLHRLVDVASHGHLSRSVTTLEIRLLNHRDYKDLAKIARIGIFPPPKRFPKVSCVRTQDIVRESTLYDDVLANRQANGAFGDRVTRLAQLKSSPIPRAPDRAARLEDYSHTRRRPSLSIPLSAGRARRHSEERHPFVRL